jgi:predicted DNA-binding transcriptional regulator YafY
MAETSLWVPVGPAPARPDPFVRPAREAIRRQCKLRIAYRDEHQASSERVVWPFALAFFQERRVMAAWCELRDAIRHFRVDRIVQAELGRERYPTPRHVLLKQWRAMHGIPDHS